KSSETKELRLDIYKWLSAPDPSSHLNAAKEQCLANTGSWFINGAQFTKWKEGINQCLWIYGSQLAPNCSSSIIGNIQNLCHNYQSQAIVYFFFDSRDSQQAFQSHHNLVKSLIKQLISVCFDLPNCLVQIYKDGTQQLSLMDLEKTLCDLLALFNKVYIILDALDECSGYLRVLKWLKELLVQSGLKLHILVTTRPEESIQRELGIMGSECLSLHEQHANDDIASYIQTTL
ncbi:hypothetical protein BU17DRAFT_8584, partial [Hysterangium stoloniferum]